MGKNIGDLFNLVMKKKNWFENVNQFRLNLIGRCEIFGTCLKHANNSLFFSVSIFLFSTVRTNLKLKSQK